MNGIPNVTLTSNKVTERVEKIFVGVPVLLSLEGSSARLDEEWFVTAAHNKLILDTTQGEVYYHPTCDIALVKEEGLGSEVAPLVVNESLRLVGYPIGLPISINSGTHIGFVNIADYVNCTATDIATATTISGMSGGGVYNNSDQLVGVVGGVITDDLYINGGLYDKQTLTTSTYFTNLYEVREWLTEVTGNEYFK
jgi:hypothetical protein